MTKRVFQKNIVLLMAVITVSKLFGMLRDIVLANFYGTSNVSDAYLIACSVPTLLFYFIGHALSTSYLPMYNKVKKEHGIQKADLFTSNITNIALLLCTIIIVALQLFPQFIVKLFAAGFDSETSALAARFIRTSAISLYCMVLVNIGSGYLQICNNFLIPAAVSLPRNFVIIASIFLASSFNVGFLGWGFLGAYLAEFLFLIPFIKKNNYKHRLYVNFKDENIKETLYLTVPIIIGVGVSQINNIVSKSIASTISEGAISALNYASVINNAVQEILVTGIITVLFADSAAHVANNEHDMVKVKLSKTIDGMVMILLPSIFGILILADPIVTVFFSRGKFNEQSSVMTVSSLRLFSIGLVFTAVRDTLIKVFYAYKKTLITTLTSIVSIVLNIILSLIFSRLIGVHGLALATSLSAVFNCTGLYVLLRKKIGDFYFANTIKVIVKSFFACLIMSLSVKLVYYAFMKHNTSILISLLVSTVIGIVVYGLAVIVLKIKPALEILGKISKRG